MLKIFYNLHPFFEDNYKEYGVREYAKLIGISPPTASVYLKEFNNEKILNSWKERKYNFYKANRDNNLFIDLMKAYYRIKLKDLIQYISKISNFPTIILFGSLAKGEANKNSDIDLYIDSNKIEINLSKFEKILKRKIELHFKPSIKNINLKNNILNGLVLNGSNII